MHLEYPQISHRPPLNATACSRNFDLRAAASNLSRATMTQDIESLEPFGVVYLVRHKASDRGYVGQTVEPLSCRWQRHQKRSSACLLLRRAIQKYGAAAFEVSVLCEAGSKTELDAKEIEWISRLKTLAPNGFNVAPGGQGGRMSAALQQKANISHSGTLTRRGLEGQAKGPSPLTADDVRAIFAAINEGASVGDMARKYGLHKSTVSHILANRTWAHLNLKVERPRRRVTPTRRVSDETIAQIPVLRAGGLSFTAIARKLGISTSLAHRKAKDAPGV